MNYDEEEVLSDSGFSLKENENLDDEPFEENDGFKSDEEEPEAL